MIGKKGYIYFYYNNPEIGDLYFYESLFHFETDEMIFVCEDNIGALYYCVCDENLHGHYSWLAVPVTKEIINDIISNKITVLAPFKDVESVLVIDCQGFETDNEDWDFYWTKYSDIDPDELPYADYYLEQEMTHLLS